MRILVQRVLDAKVIVKGKEVGSISSGLLIYLGIHHSDTEKECDYLVNKMLGLRIYENAAGKMDRSVMDEGKGLLVVSQFTLYGDCKKGMRPSFTEAARPDIAIPLYESFLRKCQSKIGDTRVASGIFGAHMHVEAINDGPINLLIESS